MALVDYSSSDSADEADRRLPPTKRRKAAVGPATHPSAATPRATPAGISEASGPDASGSDANSSKPGADVSDMPPLPSEFHDLYASTVRQSVVDDPSLHHGRHRQIPHVVGNWPTHLYVEWHPTTAQHAVLADLINDIKVELGGEVQLHNFLTSELGSPLPLHISLSRPLSLSTADKDVFLEKITHTIRTSVVAPFTVSPSGLVWFKSPDSNRTFLVLRVISSPPATGEDVTETNPNPELMSLLTRCNATVTAFDQPALYQRSQKGPAGNAFHVSIGWTFDQPDDKTSLKMQQLFEQAKSGIESWEIDVAGIKAKIGNVVNHIALASLERDAIGSRLFES
ncbi:poly(U)-specific 3'-to-5' RNA exonuclease [Neonectria punicea]|uniref:U6 snRNA phosphodiesterase n=1 Tax=Neonectria punicea TaxID=979145 RepID=A0ABR1GIC6_9HYPO